MPTLSENLLQAAFSSLVAYGMAPYGSYTKPSVSLANLLESPLHHCGTYMYLTWQFLQQFGTPAIETITLGWDDGAVGNHSQILVVDGAQSLLLDPTIGLVAYGVTFDGLIAGNNYAEYKSFFSRSDIVGFNQKVIESVTQGLYEPQDFLYKFDTLDRLYNHYSTDIRAGLEFIDTGGQISFVGSSYADSITRGVTSDYIYGRKGDDTIHLGAGNDFAYGGRDNDIIFGEAGIDNLYGEAGNDKLYGQSGDDLLYGGDGIDWLVGNAGRDLLSGGLGFDIFRFQSINDSALVSSRADVILDFQKGDRIDFSAIDANSLVAGNQAFQFIGGKPFTEPGQLRIFTVASSAQTRVILNTDSDPTNFEFLISIDRNHALTQTDFVL